MHNTPDTAASRALERDTIAAIATGSSTGGIGIVRLSGTRALDIAQALAPGKQQPRYAHYRAFLDHDGSEIDDGIVLFFPGPNSFTGEDVIELQGHGGPTVLQMVLDRCLQLGARQASPGEFSERAFLNGRLDLTQAEAIADLIAARTRSAVKAAKATLHGEFSKRINAIADSMLALRLYVEAAIDFPEEEIDFLADGQVGSKLRDLLTSAMTLRADCEAGVMLQQGATIVIAGRPNAGKSSLMNCLAGTDVAIVTPIEGTTRDTVREDIQIAGVPLRVIDTAGLRQSDDLVEQEGVRRARKEIQGADLVLHVIDDSDPRPTELTDCDVPTLTIYNKVDLSGRSAGMDRDGSSIGISTLTGAGLDVLNQELSDRLQVHGDSESRFSARQRHLVALDTTIGQLQATELQFLASGAGELLAEDLRRCHDSLGDITGRLSSDQLLGEIFSSFCIGK